MKTPPYPSTPCESRAWFQRHGITIRDWSLERNLKPEMVTDLLRGKSKGTRGHSHTAAIALGLKEDPNTNQVVAA